MQGQPWKQLEFPLFGAGAEEPEISNIESHSQRIAGYLSIKMPEPVDVIFNDNRSTMVSLKRRGGRLVVRLHRLFRHADRQVLDSLALYLGKRDQASSKVLDSFIASHKDEVRAPARTRPKKARREGKHHDLRAVLNRLNEAYFRGKIEVDIVWGRMPARRRRRRAKTVSRALATYSYDDRTIRVSPVLDSEIVPEYVLDWVVYHEMLHHVLPVEKSGDKKRYHTQRFKTLERAFEKYEEAKAWEKSHLDKLLL
jgi:predicted metal-dependent hydrolase